MLERLFAQEALLFTIPALAGTGVFLLRLALMALGGLGGDVEAGADVDVDSDFDLGADADGSDSTDAFRLLSIQSIAAVLMGFGGGGEGGFIGFDWSFGKSLLLGAAFGAALVWLLGLLMKAMYDLQTSGNVRIQDAVGVEGAVYTNVPEKGSGRGQVRVVIDGRDRIYNAISDRQAIPTSSRVRVVRVNQDHTLTVTPV